MKNPSAETKDLLRPFEAIDLYELSRRKFAALLRDGKNLNFIVLYGKRKLLIRTIFEQYLSKHPELRRCR